MKNKQVNFNIYNEQYQKSEFIDFCNSYDASFDEIKSVFIDCIKESNGEFNFSNEDFSNIQTPDQLYDFCQVNFAFGGLGRLFGRAKKKITTTFRRLNNRMNRDVIQAKRQMGRENRKKAGMQYKPKQKPANPKPAAAENKNLNNGAGSNNAAGAGTPPPANNGNIANPAPKVEPKLEQNARIEAEKAQREAATAGTSHVKPYAEYKAAGTAGSATGTASAQTNWMEFHAPSSNNAMAGGGGTYGAARPTPQATPPANPAPSAATKGAGVTRPAAEFDKSAQGVSEDLLKRKEAWKQGKSLNTYLHKQEAAAGAATRKVANTEQGRRLQDAFKNMTEQDKWKMRHGMQTSNVGKKTVNRYINQKNHVKPNTNGTGTPTPGGNKGVKGGDPAKEYWDLMEKARKAGTREDAKYWKGLADEARTKILAKQNELAGRHGGEHFVTGLNPARDATEIATFGFGNWWKARPIERTVKLGVAGGALYAGGKSAFGGNDE